MTVDAFEYDVALSFAREDQSIAEELRRLLTSKNITVFCDEYIPEANWGDDVVDHLVNLYARKARYCILLISEHYPLKQWTALERRQAQERALRDADQYILPLQLDEHPVPGITGTAGYGDLRQGTIEGVADWIDTKLTETMPTSAPPPESHDLRSGNLPSTSSEADDK
jgi:hypothetical protein